MSGQHALVSPSALATTVQCPGSLSMQLAFPETEDTPEAAEGTASHWAASEMLSGRLVDIGQTAPNGVVLSQEMVEGADLYYDHVVATLKPLGLTPSDGAVEVPVACKWIHAECWGTPDFRIWHGRHLYLWDYKFGHRTVPVVSNWQLMAYAVGCVEQAGLHDLNATIHMFIVQPRSYGAGGPVREWIVPAADLRGMVNQAVAAVTEALSSAPRTRVGPECRDCRARHACPALLDAAAGACDVAAEAQPMELPPAALGVELRYLYRARELLNARISGLEETAAALIRRGQQVPHWGLEQSAGRTSWSIPAASVVEMGRMLGIDLAKPLDAITPTQARERGVPAEVIAQASTTTRGSMKLVPDDGSKARAIFGRKTT